MKLSELIIQLQQEIERRGDLPLATENGDIRSLKIWPCRDGVSAGIGEKPNELVLEFWID